MLKDHLLLRVNNHKIQQALLAEEKLTLTKALKIAQSLETAAINAKLLSQGKGQNGTVANSDTSQE